MKSRRFHVYGTPHQRERNEADLEQSVIPIHADTQTNNLHIHADTRLAGMLGLSNGAGKKLDSCHQVSEHFDDFAFAVGTTRPLPLMQAPMADRRTIS